MKNLSTYILVSTFILASCGGGGGGGGGSTPTPPSNPAPVVNFSASSSSVATGATVTLTWSSSNATSCTASVSAGSATFTGTKGTSGTEDVAVGYGTNTFNLSCTGSGGTSSKTVSVDGTQIFNESAFVPLGQTKSYRGFVINKEIGSVACVASIGIEITNNDGFLSINKYSTNEWRYIRYDWDSTAGAYTSGLRLTEDLVTAEGDDFGTWYTVPLVDTALNGINVSDVELNPYDYEASTLEDLEQFSANISLDVDYGEDGSGYYCNPDMEIGLLASNNSSSTEEDSYFIGTSESSDGYKFIYLVSKKDWDENMTTNLASESDIFETNWAVLDVFTSYNSNPNIVLDNIGFKVKTDLVEYANNTVPRKIKTLLGSRHTNSITVSDNQTWYENDFITKFLFEGNDADSDQRFFLKADVSDDCFRSYYSFRNCGVSDYEILFFSPDKEMLFGFKLGGYDGATQTTNVKVMLNNDEE